LLGDINLQELWVGFPDEESLVKAAMGNDKLFSVLGGVVFYDMDADGKLPDDTRIAIRFHKFKASARELWEAFC
jgi:hypothetical protein